MTRSLEHVKSGRYRGGLLRSPLVLVTILSQSLTALAILTTQPPLVLVPLACSVMFLTGPASVGRALRCRALSAVTGSNCRHASQEAEGGQIQSSGRFE
jgi:hypothetical protein